MKWAFMKIYSTFLQDKSLEDLNKGNFVIATYDEIQEVEYSEVAKIVNTVHYNRYKGKCLDEIRLMYFAPEKVLLSGSISLEELRKLP